MMRMIIKAVKKILLFIRKQLYLIIIISTIMSATAIDFNEVIKQTLLLTGCELICINNNKNYD